MSTAEGPAATTAATAMPATPVSRAWTGRFTLVWFGVWMATLVPVQLALPEQFADVDHAHRVRDFGLTNGLVGILALATLPLFGALCDRTRSRFGRRRVWAAGGVAVFAAGLVLTGQQTTWVGVALAWALASLGGNMVAAALTAVVADQVLEQQRGMVSGAIYGPQSVGIVVGLLVVGGMATGARYGVLALALVVCALPFLIWSRDTPALKTPPLSARAVVAGFWISPRRHPDFAWAFGSRLLVNLGNAFGTTFLLFFLRDELRVPDPDAALLQLTLVYLVFTLTATYAGGLLSDHLGRRRVFVATASTLQAIAALLLALYPSFGTAAIGAALLGAGYGAFMSVDQALVTAVLPDPADRAKDLGILNVGSVGPQAFGPLIGSVVISSLGGYTGLYLCAGVATLLGTAFVYRIRSVR